MQEPPNPIDPSRRRAAPKPRHGLARTLSRMGICSRTEAERRIRAGRVAVNGTIVRDPELPVDGARERITLDGAALRAPARTCIMLHKPRGVTVSTQDEHGRDTVYALLADAGLPWLAPVGRLDRASEGLLLLTNDPAWAARITDPASGIAKTYRVQVRGRVDPAGLRRLGEGIVDRGERLVAAGAAIVGGGERNTWCELVLREGRNRELRRMFGALGHEVLRLIRIAVGPLVLGDLPKGAWRALTAAEVDALGAPAADTRRAALSSGTPGRRSRSRPPRDSRPRR